MTPEQWEHVCTLFEAAIPLPQEERDAFVASLVEEPDPVRRELQGLLAEHDDGAPSILATQLGEAAGDWAAAEANAERLTPIGPYQPERVLGRGGMGVVYLASRADGQFDQRVALKLVKQGLDSEATRRRFLFERQVLARLQHPGIARLLDGGVSEDGQAYFAMEYVEGESLFTYVERHGLSLEARLRLFVQVCDAVEYAHRNLIVHRDLKPGNILVTEDGEPRLLDFGIAKWLEEGDGANERAPVTQTSMALLTPEYGAPEQLMHEPITAATDVYALGGILFELLTGRRPYDLGRRSPVEIYEAVLREQPVRPSTALVTGPESSPKIALSQRLHRQLQGDLDVITLKCLAKTPERRYRSAGALADDLRRHLAGQPISARADSATYLFGRFLKRYRLAVGAAVLVLTSLIGGLGVAAWQGQVAARESRRASSVSTFVVEMLAAVSPDQAQGRDVTVREVLDQAVASLDDPTSELSAEPAVEAAIRATIGNTYRELAYYDEALSQLQQSFAINESILGERHEETVRRLSDIGATHFVQAQIDEAEGYYLQALSRARARWGERHELTQHIVSQMAGVHFRRGEYGLAEEQLRLNVEMRRELLGPNHGDTLTSQANLAASLSVQDRWEESMPLLEDVVARQTRVLGEGARATLVARGNLADAYNNLDRMEEAVSHAQAVVSIRERVLGEDHPEVIESRLRLAAILKDAFDYDRSAAEFARALSRADEILGEQHFVVLIARGNYGSLLASQGRLTAADEEFTRSINGLTQVLGEEHPTTVDMRRLRRVSLEAPPPVESDQPSEARP
ncbi:MAG: serine/threonine-protein kinase [Pseudomonadota bacterium]